MAKRKEKTAPVTPAETPEAVIEETAVEETAATPAVAERSVEAALAAARARAEK